MVRRGMRFKIVLAIVIIVSIFTILLEVMGVNFSKKMVEAQLFKDYQNYNKLVSETIMTRLNNYMQGILTVSENKNLKEAIDHPEYKEFMRDVQRSFQITDPFIKLTYMGTENARTIFFPKVDMDEEKTDSTHKAWYQQAIKADGVQWTQPYIDEITQETIITLMAAIKKDNKLVGVFGADIDFSFLRQYLIDTKYAKTGVSYIVSTETGNLILHSDPEVVNQVLEEQVWNLVSSKEDSFKVIRNQNGEKKLLLYNHIPSLGASLVTEIDYGEVTEVTDQMKKMILLFGIIAAVVLIGSGYVLATFIVDPIQKVTRAAEQIAEGDFDVQLSVKSNDEIGALSKSFQKTIDQLVNYQGYIDEMSDILHNIAEGDLNVSPKREYIGQFEKLKLNMEALQSNLSGTLLKILKSSGEVDISSNQVANASKSLSNGAVEQAGAIEELSASIAHVTEQIRINSKNAENAKERAEIATKEVSQSNHKMQEMMSAMEEINFKSSQISKIIKMIDDIAFQTNILALNAAVEAARAGETGKGFAVVADEVRNLATRSADAVKNTTSLINETIVAVNNGTEIAKQTSEALEKTSEAARETMLLIDEISVASDEQSQAMEQVNLGIEQTSSVVQMNAATAEQTASTSHELSEQSNLLKDLISQFKLKM